MCVKQVLQWVGIIPKPQKQPQQVQVPTAPPAQLQTRAAAALSETEKLQDEEIETTLNKKQKAKLARKTLGVKSLGAVEPPTNAAPLGINPGSYG